MTVEHSDFDRTLRAWFADGPTLMSDRVVDGIEDAIAREPQRRSWRLHGRPWMNSYTKLAAAAAAVLIIGAVGWRLVATGGIGTGPTSGRTNPLPAQTSASSATPESTSPPRLPEGVVTAGTYVAQPYRRDADLTTFEVTVPTGWRGYDEWSLWAPEGLEFPDGLGIGILRPTGLFSDPCHWDAKGDRSWPQHGDVVVGPTAADLVAALKRQTAYRVTPGTDTTLDGRPVKRIDLRLPATPDPFAECDKPVGMSTGAYTPFGPSDLSGSDLYAQGPGQIWHLWILDIGSRTWVIVINDYEGTASATYAAAEAIVGSMRIRT